MICKKKFFVDLFRLNSNKNQPSLYTLHAHKKRELQFYVVTL